MFLAQLNRGQTFSNPLSLPNFFKVMFQSQLKTWFELQIQTAYDLGGLLRT